MGGKPVNILLNVIAVNNHCSFSAQAQFGFILLFIFIDKIFYFTTAISLPYY